MYIYNVLSYIITPTFEVKWSSKFIDKGSIYKNS